MQTRLNQFFCFHRTQLCIFGRRPWFTALFIIAVFFPSIIECLAFAGRNDGFNIGDKCIGSFVLNNADGMPSDFVQLQNGISKCRLEKSGQSIVFIPTDGKERGINGNQSANDASQKSRREIDYAIHRVSLQVLIMAIGPFVVVLLLF